jgi:hypothetical protein
VENFKVLWTTAGVRHVSVVSYDAKSAKERVEELAKTATDVEMVPVKPGETVTVEQPRRGRVVQRKHAVK